MMLLFAIDPSGLGQIPKHNHEQLDDVALHERVHKLESDHHTRDAISELQSKRCNELENKITDLSTSLLQHANSIKTLKPTHVSIAYFVKIKICILLNIPQIQQMMPALLNMYLQNKQ